MAKARALLALLAALALPLASCGHGHHHHHDDDGTLEVCNDFASTWGIDEVEVEDEFGDIIVYEVFLAPGECDFVDDFEEDEYIVRLFWSDGNTVDEFFVDIFDDEITTVTGFNDLP
jgi:hypothetical protein